MKELLLSVGFVFGLIFLFVQGCGQESGPEEKSFSVPNVEGLWGELEMTLVSNTCGPYPLESIENLHPYYIIRQVTESTAEIIDCGLTRQCDDRSRSLGVGQFTENVFEVVLVKSKEPVFINDPDTEDWNCWEQDTIGVQITFDSSRSASEVRKLANVMEGDGCEAFVEEYSHLDQVNYEPCEAVFTYKMKKL